MTISDIITALTTRQAGDDTTLFPPATDSQISHFEAAIKAPLPADIWQFYSFSNGLDTRDYLFRLLPLDEILEQGLGFGPHQFVFAEYMIYSDTWQIQLDPGDPTVYWIRNDAVAHPLTPSLAAFLDRFLANGLFRPGGIHDWHEEVGSAEEEKGE